MKNLKLHVAVMISTMLATPAVLAIDSKSADIAANYSAANWMLSDKTGKPYPASSSTYRDISARYLDANWIVISVNDKSQYASNATEAGNNMTLERGEN